MWETIFTFSFLLASLLVIWFKTEAFSEYCSLLKLDFYFDIISYQKEKEINPNLTYPDFLILFYNSFFVRLISCPKCVSVWVSIFFYFYHKELSIVPIIYVLGLILYYLTSFLEKKAYE